MAKNKSESLDADECASVEKPTMFETKAGMNHDVDVHGPVYGSVFYEMAGIGVDTRFR